jgi:signal peptidase II
MNGLAGLSTRFSRTGGLVSLLLLSVGSDQLSKGLAGIYLRPGAPLSFCGDVLRLEYVENSGGFLGFLGGLPEEVRFRLLTFGVAGLLAAAAFFILWKGWFDRRSAALTTLVVGGGLGNLIDRLVNEGKVIDFINIGIGGFRTGIFNLADVYILAASFALGVLVAQGDLRWQEDKH